MANFVMVISSELNKLKNRIVKFTRYGRGDHRTSIQAAPFGVDSVPLKGMVGFYAQTEEKDSSVILGYLHKDLLANVGETRLFSVKSNGTVSTFVWLKNDETMLLGGEGNFATRFNELKAGFDQLKSDHNDLVTAFNAHMHATAASGPPSPPTPGAGIPATASAATIDGAKNEKIKMS